MSDVILKEYQGYKIEIGFLREITKTQEAEIAKLKEENERLALAVVNNTLISQETKITPEEEICDEQLRILNRESKNRELTLDESRKVDTYVKIKKDILAAKKKAGNDDTRTKTTSELLAELNKAVNG